MKILTKKWAEKREQVRMVHSLKEFDVQTTSYESIIGASRAEFCNSLSQDYELAKICLRTDVVDKLYESRLERDRKLILSLPKDVYNKITDIKSVILGYANDEDKKLLTAYADQALRVVEKEAEEANRLTEIAEDYLPEEFIVDEAVGELVYDEYSCGKDYFINVGCLRICVEDYQILEREEFKVNKWEEDNPLSLWTALDAAELHYLSNGCYELHLMLVDGDKYANKKYWYFTLKGTNVKYQKLD